MSFLTPDRELRLGQTFVNAMSTGLFHGTINVRGKLCFLARVTMPSLCHSRPGRHIPAVGRFSAVRVPAPSIVTHTPAQLLFGVDKKAMMGKTAQVRGCGCTTL